MNGPFKFVYPANFGNRISEPLNNSTTNQGVYLGRLYLTKYVLAGASDGYQVLFALTELDSSFTDRKIILTTQVDSHSLPANEGPFRIIVADEKLPARCIRQLKSLVIKFAG